MPIALILRKSHGSRARQPSRRSIVAGLLCGCGACGTGILTALDRARAEDGGTEDIQGCLVPSARIEFLGSRKPSFGNVQDLSALRRTTGNAEMDLALDRALKRLADTFHIYPGFGFVDDSDGPNAWATPRAYIKDTPGTVAFGREFFDALLRYDPTGISVIAVVAHEFGHILQFTTGMVQRIKGGDSTVKRLELHADYMSGFYIGQLKKAHPEASFWRAGDKFRQIGTYDKQDPLFHGTPEERVAASQAGFKLAYEETTDIGAAFDRAMTYVSTM